MKIFISYRRADSKYVVDRIRDRLMEAYDEDAIFRDLESIPPGQNFSDVLKEATTTCDVMLVVIGPQWAGITDEQGNKRLFELHDYTRLEVEAGLANKKILVIPLLVMNARMPSIEEIPASLADLRFRNAISIRNDPDFTPDMQRLILGINEQFPSAGNSKFQPKKEGQPMDAEKKDEKGPVGSARIKGDQNTFSGNVSSGGIVFQGGRHKNITINQSTGPGSDELATLFDNIYKHIETRAPDPNVDKEEILETVQKIQEEAARGEKDANETKLTRWMDTLNKIAPDVIDVALASLGGPVSGVTAVLKKIADHAHQQTQS